MFMDTKNISGNGDSGRKVLRLLRPSVVVLCGPAACGKSTFAERHFRPTQIISSDWARARVCDDDRDQRFNSQAFALAHFLVEQRLAVNRLCVVDSTALTALARKDLLELAKKYKVPAVLILFEVPLEKCVEQDEKRERSVGRDIIERQYQAFEQSKITIRQEGFDQVVELQDGELDKVQVEVRFRPVVQTQQRSNRVDTGTARRPERSLQPYRPRQSGPDDRRSVSSAPVAHPTQRTALPAVAPSPTTVPTPAVASPKPTPSAAPPAAPTEAQSADES